MPLDRFSKGYQTSMYLPKDYSFKGIIPLWVKQQLLLMTDGLF